MTTSHSEREAKGGDTSERKRTRKDKDKEKDFSRSERKKKHDKDKEKDTSRSERKKKYRSELSERRKEDKKKQKNKELTLDSTVEDRSERKKKKQPSILKGKVKKFVTTLQKQEQGKAQNKTTDTKSTKEKPSTRETKEKATGNLKAPSEAQITAFNSFVKGVFQNGVEGLVKEYAILKPYLSSKYAREIFDKNVAKNRYKDVICNDYTRVILNDGKPGDYIHANYVKGENLLNTFICTQGPLPNTIEDFWRMVVGEKVAHVVMLCDTVENGRTKCEQYWPNMQDQKLEFGDFTLTNIKVNASDHHVVRSTIEVVVKGGQRLFVKHHRWKTWPDKTVPKSLLAVFRILQVVRGTSRPIVIHCSAGIGRTGSVVAIEMGLQTLLAGQKLNLLDVCRKVRDQRMHSVQVEVQYVYVAEALCEYGKVMEYWKDPELLQMFTKFKASFDDYVSKLPVHGQAPAQAYPPAASHPGVPLNAPPPLIAAPATPPQSPVPDVVQALRQPPPMVADAMLRPQFDNPVANSPAQARPVFCQCCAADNAH